VQDAGRRATEMFDACNRLKAEAQEVMSSARQRLDESLSKGESFATLASKAAAAAQNAAERSFGYADQMMSLMAPAAQEGPSPQDVLDRLESDYRLLSGLVQELHARIATLFLPTAPSEEPAAAAAEPAEPEEPASEPAAAEMLVAEPVAAAPVAQATDAWSTSAPAIGEPAPAEAEPGTDTEPEEPEAGTRIWWPAEPVAAPETPIAIEPPATTAEAEPPYAKEAPPAPWTAQPDSTPEPEERPAADRTGRKEQATKGWWTDPLFPPAPESPAAETRDEQAPEAASETRERPGNLPEAEPPAADSGADHTETPLEGKILVKIAPVPDFDRLLNLDGALGRMQAVQNVTLADYTREEVSFRIELSLQTTIGQFCKDLADASGYRLAFLESDGERLQLRLESTRS